MDMNIIKTEKRLCTCCMEEHEVKTVIVKEQSSFKNIKVCYDAVYNYCDLADEFYMDENQMQENDLRLKDAYRAAAGYLTVDEIRNIRDKYGISQGGMCLLLGWGGKTITRYESHQVQDRAHDMILRKIDDDPQWFLSLLMKERKKFSPEAYYKYYASAIDLYEKKQESYLRKSIEASYAKFYGNEQFNGNAVLSLDKVVDVIRYFAASEKISNLYKVKLMKMMWYADALAYKLRSSAITGLVYQALPMGAVPVAHNSIIDLKGVPCEEIDMDETTAYYFSLKEEENFPTLSDDEVRILDIVIDKFGHMTKKEIVEFMHNEQAYIETAPRDIIQFKYAKNLQI